MNSSDILDCLYENGLISESQYEEGKKIAPIVGYDIGAVFAIMGASSSSGPDDAPFVMAQSAPITSAATGTIPLQEGALRIVATAFGNDAVFAVVGDPTLTKGHVMKQGLNYSFTAQEWANIKFLAASASSTTQITATFYK